MGTERITPPRDRRAWPLLPLAPAIVILVGLAVAVAVGFFGVANLAAASDDHAAARAELLASTLAARLSQLPSPLWLETMQRAARKTGAELVIVTRDGQVTFDASLGIADPDALKRVSAQPSGEAVTGLGRTRFRTEPLAARGTAPLQVLVAFVRAPSAPRVRLRSSVRWLR